ncbi:MAG TPA: transcriptional repressor [Acidimicrobiales bacterium]
MSNAAVEDILQRLRAGGGRVTTARRALVTALIEHDGHPTAEGLATAVQARQPDVHQATIYRILDDLERLDVVQHTHFGHGPAVYHLTASAHPHLVCERCGRVIEVNEAVFDSLVERVEAAHRFLVRPGHFAVSGICEQCEARPRAGSA